ncbi:response regulator transcription factor [Candidatus Uabimicrobium amorphum]|uniref:DNA-binding response regulator n=1 Tax=Uabimicrobium amorphum TaxID=2596890 RepID=A0A5S9IM81_UABAM|nr:response regulator [Candidatus Uabimicrobium amorphum]BBM84111.1 DNA-binding response regulator [Candidatus Uabimicrobium amorphum]
MKKILVIDDEASLIKLLKRVLEKKGYSVAAYTDERAGLAAFNKEQYDLLAVDFNLRSISGEQIICEVKSKDPSFPVLIMSGKTNDFVEKKAYENTYFMLKPFSITEFAERVKVLLES